MNMIALARPQVNTSINKDSVQRIAHQFSYVPQELKLRPQWVVWKWGSLRPDGKRAKVPINPHTGSYASASASSTWSTYLEAILTYARDGYEGIGFVFNGDDITGIDLDNCIQDGKIDPWAKEIIDQINGYTEISPSGKGVKIIVRAAPTLDRGNRTEGRIEVYTSNRYFTLTGQCISRTIQLEDRQAEVEAWYRATFPQPIAPHVDNSIQTDINLEDNQILNVLMRAKNAAKFKRLWEGNTKGYPSHSEADLALFSLLAPYTQDAEQLERIARRSGLLRDKWDTHPTYLTDSIEKAIDYREFTYQSRKREDSRTEHSYAWQQSQEERNLQGIAHEVRESVRRHIEEGSESVLVIQVPPGVGKSTAVAEWGKDQNIAYIVERHEQVNQVRALQEYRHIQPCTSKNCPESEIANLGSSLGYNMWALHGRHDCEYAQQFYEPGSAVYQIAHAQTAYPVRHTGVVVDELNVASWIMGHAITVDRVKQAKQAHNPTQREAARFLQAWRTVLQDEQALSGKALFDRLSEECDGKLEEIITAIEQDEALMEERPRMRDTDAVTTHAPIILPAMVKAIKRELPKWKTGNEWNGQIRVDMHKGEYALLILEPRRFQGHVPLAILDATAHPGLYSQSFGRPMQVKTVQLDPPPNMKHIAVRTGKRYGKGTLTTAKNKERDVQRVVKELRYLLNEIDPNRTKSVGLITYQGCEDTIGDALGIAEQYRGHFWGVRGSNAFEDCEILLVVGTPTPNLDEVVHWARMLYADDPQVIDTTVGPDGKYRDVRLRELVEYLVNAELTQCAHRNRPLRHDGRTVITLSSGTVDFLPITTEIHQLPQLKDDGKSQTAYDLERLSKAEAALGEKGLSLTVRNMIKEIGRPGISNEKLAAYVRKLKATRDK